MSVYIECDGVMCKNIEGFDCETIYELSYKATNMIKEFTRETGVKHLCPECVEEYNENLDEGQLVLDNITELLDFVKDEEC